MEEWVPVSGLEGRFDVSTLGRIRRLAHLSPGGRRLSAKMAVLSSSRGYRVVEMGGRSYAVHRIVCEAFNGPPPAGNNVARHLNDIKQDNRLENLRWGTPADNVADCTRNGNNSRRTRTHCPRGHPHSEYNNTSAAQSRGRRYCKSCHRARSWATVRGVANTSHAARVFADLELMRLRDGC